MDIEEYLLDAEDRNALARGAMDALGDLLAGLDPLNRIDPAKFFHLFQAVNLVVKDAVLLPGETPRQRGANDDE